MKENDKQKEQGQTKNTGWRKLSNKRWVYPAMYIAAVALILTGVLWMQSNNNKNDVAQKDKLNDHSVTYTQNGKDAVPANSFAEVFQMPVADQASVDIEKQFYDANGSIEEQQAALVNYNNTYQQSTGIDIAEKDGKSFTVTASMSGTVEKAKQDSLLGYVVILKHKNGVETYYESMKSIAVKPGDEVSQGDIIGEAGQDEFDKSAGVHLHFEIRKDGIPVNPVAYFKKDVSSLSDVSSTSSKPKSKEKSNQDNMNNSNEQNNAPNQDNNAPSQDNNNAPNQDNNNAPNQDNNNSPSQDNNNSDIQNG